MECRDERTFHYTVCTKKKAEPDNFRLFEYELSHPGIPSTLLVAVSISFKEKINFSVLR